jgi:hypothetical protein
MAVTHKLYGPFLKNIMTSTIGDIGAAEFRVKIMTDGHAFNQDHEYWSQVSANEQSTSTTGNEDYEEGGQLLVGVETSYTDKITTLSASSETEFTTEGDVSGFYAVVCASSYLVSCVDFDGEEKSVQGTFKITWTDNKILTNTVSA